MQSQWHRRMNIICWRHALKRWERERERERQRERERERSVTYCVLFDSACNVILAFFLSRKLGNAAPETASCLLVILNCIWSGLGFFCCCLPFFFFLYKQCRFGDSSLRIENGYKKRRLLTHEQTFWTAALIIVLSLLFYCPGRVCDSPSLASDIEHFIPSFVDRLIYIGLWYMRNFGVSGFSTFENN